MTGKSERELLEASRAGDERAIDELLRRHETRVYRFGLRMCGSEEDAKEVLQETLLTAFRELHNFRAEAALSTWLYQIARSHCSRAMRKRAGAPDEHLPLDGPAASAVTEDAPTPDAASQARQIGEVLEVAIRALPEKLREALILRDVEGLSAAEAAEAAGVEVGALKSRLHRARLQMREHLAALLGESSTENQGGCAQLAGELRAYAAEEIDQAACERIEEHLETCPDCADACDDLRRTVSLCRRIPGDEVPAPVRSAVRHALVRAANGSEAKAE